MIPGDKNWNPDDQDDAWHHQDNSGWETKKNPPQRYFTSRSDENIAKDSYKGPNADGPGIFAYGPFCPSSQAEPPPSIGLFCLRRTWIPRWEARQLLQVTQQPFHRRLTTQLRT